MGETGILMDTAGANQFPRFHAEKSAGSESVNSWQRADWISSNWPRRIYFAVTTKRAAIAARRLPGLVLVAAPVET
jgi:hypothetical protein